MRKLTRGELPSVRSNDLLNSSAFAFLACVSQNYKKSRMCFLRRFLNEDLEGEFLNSNGRSSHIFAAI